MSDAIDEIQNKDRRQKGLDAWAEMLARIHSRGPAEARQQEESVSGGSSLPREPKVVDPQAAEKKARMIEQAKARQAAEAEIRRLADQVVLSQSKVKAASKAEAAQSEAPKTETPTKTEAPKASPPPRPATPAPVAAKAAVVVVQPESGETAAPQTVQPELKAAPAERLQENSASAVEEVRQMTSLAGLDTVEKEESEPQVQESTPAEEALRLAQLRSGVGANPELAAKEYVLASELPGVKDTLGGGIYEEFRVAL